MKIECDYLYGLIEKLATYAKISPKKKKEKKKKGEPQSYRW